MSAQPKIVNANDGGLWTVFGEQVRAALLSEHTGGRVAVCEVTTPPGGGPPPHVHEREDELFYVLDGELEAFSHGTWTHVPTGGTVFLPRGIPHTFRNASARPCRFLAVITPGGFERFFADLSALDAKGLVTPDVAARCAAVYGVEFLAG